MTEKSSDVTRRLLSRRAFTTTAAAAAAIAPFAVASQATAEPSGTTTGTTGKTAGEPGDLRRITLYVEKLPDGQMGYGLEPGKPTIPGP
ncbi:hypothetical protein, partial [Microbispora rosea]